MTEIYNVNGVSIQSFQVARVLLASGTARIDDFNLDRGGRFLGGTITGDSDHVVGDTSIEIVELRDGDSSDLTYGKAVTALEALLRNGGSVGRNCGWHAIIFIGVS